MLYDVTVGEWKGLRFILRDENIALGYDIRWKGMGPNRKNKDGKFLEEWIRRGWIEEWNKAPFTCARLPFGTPEPFKKFYRLTEVGKKVAEFGEYEMEFNPNAKLARKKVPSRAKAASRK